MEREVVVIAVRAERVFDGERLVPAATTVLVSGERIVDVVGAHDALPAGTRTTSHPGATLLPGLIDAHVHLCADGGPGALDRLPDHDGPALTRIIETSLAQQAATGVTTVRDLGDRDWAVLDWRAERARSAGLPRVLASGPPLTGPRGHCWNMGGQVSGEDELRAAVRERARRGADVVKIMASGGANTPGSDMTQPQFTAAEIAAVVDEAHALGLPVTAHAHALAAIRSALEAGVDGIEHCTFLTADAVDVDPEVVEALALRGVDVCPTLGVRPGVTPPPALMDLLQRTGATVESRREHVAAIHSAGVTILTGTDGGISPGKTHGLMPHSMIELGLGGVTPRDVLASATSVPADAFGLGGLTGRLAPGLAADLLVVEGDPLDDLTALLSVAAVYVRGVPIAQTV